MSARPAALAALALAAAAGLAAAADEPRRTYLRRCQDQDGPAPRLLEDLDAALERGATPGEQAYLLDRLLEEAAAPAARGLVVELEPERYAGLRAHVLARCDDLPRATVDALRAAQTRAAAGAARALDAAALLRRFPYAAAGLEAARALLSRALAAGDVALARAHLAAIERLHPDEVGPQERAAAALMAALAPPTRRAGAAPVKVGSGPLLTRWSVSLGQKGDPSTDGCLVHPAYLPAPGGDRVVASTGARVVVVDADRGEVVGRVPLALEAASLPPDPSTGFAARVAGGGGLALTPLVLERWLAPARAGDLAGRYYSLVTVDLAQGRLQWWDGDPGPRADAADRGQGAAPPGLTDLDPALATALRDAHVVACAADAARVYVALLPRASEPELSLFAYERAGGAGQPLVLRPAWAAPVPLFAAERPARVSPEDEPVAPELAACLELDGAGRLLVTTDAGVAACLDVGAGAVQWVVRPEPAPGVRRARQFGRLTTTPPVPPQPAWLVDGPDGPRAVLVAGDLVLCARLRDGTTAWSLPRGRAGRVLVTDTGHVVIYGERELIVSDAVSGALRHRGAAASEPVCGEAVAVGDVLLLPVRDGAGAKLRRIDLQTEGRAVRALLSGLTALPEHVPPINLAITPRGLLVASGRTLTLHGWER